MQDASRVPNLGLRVPNPRKHPVYTKGVFRSENSSASTGKKQVWCIPKSLFSREKTGQRRKIHIHQRGFQVFVGDPFAQNWCIDFGLLLQGKWDFLTRNTFFWGGGKWGFFDSETLFSPILGISAPVRGKRIPNPCCSGVGPRGSLLSRSCIILILSVFLCS